MLRSFSKCRRMTTVSLPATLLSRRYASPAAAATPSSAAPDAEAPAPMPKATPTQLSASEELAQGGEAPQPFSGKPDPRCVAHCKLALKIIATVVREHEAKGLSTKWLTPRRRDQLEKYSKLTAEEVRVEDLKEEETAEAAEESTAKEVSTPRSAAHELVNLFTSYIRFEDDIHHLIDSAVLPQRMRGKLWQENSKAYQLTPMERQYVLHLVCNAVEKREVPLVVITRLLRRRWPGSIMDVNTASHHRFITRSVFAWIAELLQKDELTPVNARATIDNCAFALKASSGTALVGKMAMVAIRDIDEKDNPEALIALMWGVSSTGVHAPDNFWRRIFLRLTALNRSLKETNDPLESQLEKTSASDKPGRASRKEMGHVFSGLTTRQIYRILAVLKNERWSSEAGEMHELADQALKNIVFEAEALTLSEGEMHSSVSRKVLVDRLRSISDLSFQEFLTLITIAGDLGVPFHISALRISDILFVPLTQYLDQHQMLTLLVVVRQTRCYSPSLMTTIANRLILRGHSASFALPLAKAFVRAALKEKTLFALPKVVEFVQYFFDMCVGVVEKVRSSEISTLADIVYGIYRLHVPESHIGLKAREVIDLLCKQADRLLQLRLTSSSMPSKLLELTIVMNMRDNPKRYVNTMSLLQTRNTASSKFDSALQEEVALLASMEGDDVPRPPAEEVVEAEKNVEEVMTPGAKEKASEFEQTLKRWTAMEEKDLPGIPKSALQVYNELLYFFEKIAVVKNEITKTDGEKFKDVMEHTGLFNIFLGAHLMQQGHLSPSSTLPAAYQVLNALPPGIHRRAHRFIAEKLAAFKRIKSPTNDDYLKILGQVHCNSEKVGKFIHIVEHSCLISSNRQRDLWVFIYELSERFGDDSQKAKAKSILENSLF